MPAQQQDPMISYNKFIKTPNNKLNIKEINMSQLRLIYKKLNKSNSTSFDNISMNTLVKLKTSTQPLILNLVNMVIKSSIFPTILKTSRIIPIKKGAKMMRWIQQVIDQ